MLCRLLNALAPGTPVDAMRADDPSLLDEVRITAGSEGRWVVFDVTPAAQAWYAGTAENLGLRFRDKDYANHDDGQVGFYSSDSPRAGLRPIFVVER